MTPTVNKAAQNSARRPPKALTREIETSPHNHFVLQPMQGTGPSSTFPGQSDLVEETEGVGGSASTAQQASRLLLAYLPQCCMCNKHPSRTKVPSEVWRKAITPLRTLAAQDLCQAQRLPDPSGKKCP
jgi:hypothetical protein